MFLFLFIAAIVVCSPLFVAAGDLPPQACTAMSVTHYEHYFGQSDSTTNVAFNLKLFKFGGNTTWVTVGPVSYTSTDGRIPDYICANVPFDVTIPDQRKCGNLDSTFSFSLQEPSFYLHGHFNGYWDAIFSGYADDGTFSNEDGTFLTSAQPSYSSVFTNRNTRIVDTQNCTTFAPAPVAPPKAPRCKSFESQTIVLNLDNTTYATSVGSYGFLDGNHIYGQANFTGPDGYFVFFWLNGVEACSSQYPNACTWELFEGDGKVIIDSNIVKLIGSEYIGVSVPLIGRIIIRGNETLMSEGIPYTKSNPCIYTNFQYGDGQISNNEFCCTEFEQA